jgi:YVTN family beta-propeller protein
VPRSWARRAALVLGLALLPAVTNAQNAYITNHSDGTVSVIDTGTNTVIATIVVGINPYGVAVTLDGTKVYVANEAYHTVSVIDTTTNAVTATIPVENEKLPVGVAVTPDGAKAYVVNTNTSVAGDTVSVVDTVSNKVAATIPVAEGAAGIAVTPDGSRVT